MESGYCVGHEQYLPQEYVLKENAEQKDIWYYT